MTIAEYLRLKRWGKIEREIDHGYRRRMIDTCGGALVVSIWIKGDRGGLITSINASDVLADDWREIEP